MVFVFPEREPLLPCLRLEAHHVGAVLDDLELAGVDVDVAVLALHQPVRVARLQLEGPVGRLVAVSVGAILVVPGNIPRFIQRRILPPTVTLGRQTAVD